MILSPSALERCQEPGDWLRREIETAIEYKRNVIPLMMEGFDFGSPTTVKALTGKLADLKKYNALGVPAEYFEAAMEKLHSERFLNRPLASISHPVSDITKQITEKQKSAAVEATSVGKGQLAAQKWYERGYIFSENGNFDEAIRCFTEAISIKTDFAYAYSSRGFAIIETKGNPQQALSDLNNAIKLKPDEYTAYNNRGRIYHERGKKDKALDNYNLSIKYNPNYHFPYNNRGMIYQDTGNFDEAIKSYNKAISLKSDYIDAYINRGLLRFNKGEYNLANKDYSKVIKIDPHYANAYYNRALVWERNKDYSSAIADYQNYLNLGGGKQEGDQKEVEETIKKLKSKLVKKKLTKKKPK